MHFPLSTSSSAETNGLATKTTACHFDAPRSVATLGFWQVLEIHIQDRLDPYQHASLHRHLRYRSACLCPAATSPADLLSFSAKKHICKDDSKVTLESQVHNYMSTKPLAAVGERLRIGRSCHSCLLAVGHHSCMADPV